MVSGQPGPRRIVLSIVATTAALVLLFSYRTSFGGSVPSQAAAGAAAPGIVPDTTQPPAGPTPAGSTGSTGSASPAGPASPGRSAGSPPTKNLTVNGTVAQTRWGPVQVQIKITDGKIVDVQTLQHPHGNGRDDEINSYALPQLHDEVLQAQSAQIDGVSGATVTSDGYIESLQAALDTAHFGR